MVFEKLQEALREIQSDLEASECHGVLCGLMSSSASFSRNRWLEHMTGSSALNIPSGQSFEVLEELEKVTVGALSDPEFGFNLLLDHDYAQFPKRLESFVYWCRGYLSGFGLGDIVELDHLGEDSQEFLKDLERFCLIDCYENERDLEESEKSFIELVEFTRVGVLLLHLDARATFGTEK